MPSLLGSFHARCMSRDGHCAPPAAFGREGLRPRSVRSRLDGAERVGGRRCSIARDETFLAAHAPGERAWMHEAADVLTPRRAIEHMRARIERGHRRLEIEVHRKIQRARVARPRRDRARLQVYDRNDPSHGSSKSILTGDRAFCLPIALQSEDQGGAWRFEYGRAADTIRNSVPTKLACRDR